MQQPVNPEKYIGLVLTDKINSNTHSKNMKMDLVFDVTKTERIQNEAKCTYHISSEKTTVVTPTARLL